VRSRKQRRALARRRSCRTQPGTDGSNPSALQRRVIQTRSFRIWAALALISPVRPGSGRGQTWRSRSRQEPKALRPGTHTPDLHLWWACIRPSWLPLRRPSSGRRTSWHENACPFPFKSRRRSHHVRRAPGPIELAHRLSCASIGSLWRTRPQPAPSPARCARRKVGRRSPAAYSASSSAATLPWPKIRRRPRTGSRFAALGRFSRLRPECLHLVSRFVRREQE
jgi:hypothetical protein